MRGLHPDTYKPVLCHYCLRKMKGEFTAYDLVKTFFEMTGLYINMKENTFENIFQITPMQL